MGADASINDGTIFYHNSYFNIGDSSNYNTSNEVMDIREFIEYKVNVMDINMENNTCWIILKII